MSLVKFVCGLLPTLFIWLILRNTALQNPSPATISDLLVSLWHNLPGALQLFGKTLLPFNLSVLPIIQDTSLVWGILAMILLITALIWQLKKLSVNTFLIPLGLLWFLIFLIPSLINPNPQEVTNLFEHRLYLPIIGLLIVFAEMFLADKTDQSATKPTNQQQEVLPILTYASIPEQKKSIINRPFERTRSGDNNERIALTTGFLIIPLFFILTFIHQNQFADRMVFWQAAAASSPHAPLAQKNLGAMYFLDGDYSSAKIYFTKALVLNPYEAMTHYNLGLIDVKQGLIAEAERQYLIELSFNPAYDEAHYSLGLIYVNTNRLPEAKIEMQKTLSINPDHQGAMQALEIINKTLK